MKLIFLVIFFLSLSDIHAQPLNRIYGSLNLGYRKHQEFAVTVHVFRHLSFGWNAGVTHIPTGPVYFPNPGLFGFGRKLKNEYESRNFFFGFTTQTFKQVNCSVMAGPSFYRSLEYSNITVHENEYSHAEWVTETSTRNTAIGIALRADLAISLSRVIGINFSFQSNLNSIRNDYNLLIGLNVGLVEDFLER